MMMIKIIIIIIIIIGTLSLQYNGEIRDQEMIKSLPLISYRLAGSSRFTQATVSGSCPCGLHHDRIIKGKRRV
jgi:hypothetical protein